MHPAIRVRVTEADEGPQRRRATFRRKDESQERAEATAAGTIAESQ
jgi:hypothetical protein